MERENISTKNPGFLRKNRSLFDLTKYHKTEICTAGISNKNAFLYIAPGGQERYNKNRLWTGAVTPGGIGKLEREGKIKKGEM